MNDDTMSAILEQEDEDSPGYATIITPSPRNSRNFDLGAPLGPSKTRGGHQSVIVNNAARSAHAEFRHNSWNANPRSGVIIQHLNSIPPDAERPQIVEVTGMEGIDEEDGDGRGITNPDYPRSEPDRSGRIDEYPTLPMDAGPPLPDRDYHGNSDSRPDIQRLSLNAGDDGDPPGVTDIPPSFPPPPPLPQVQRSEESSTQPSQGNDTTQLSQGKIEVEVPENQEIHIVLRRALARNFDTTQPNQDEADQSQGVETERVSSCTQTRHSPLQSTQVQTTLDRPSRRDDPSERQLDNRENTGQSGEGTDQRSNHRQSSQNRESSDHTEYGPDAFHPFSHREDHPTQRPRSGVETDTRPRRSSRIIEQIIITREIDPSTGQPFESAPVQRPSRPRSGHNIAYNNSVRDSGRRSRGWAPFSESQRHWSPGDGNEHVELTGIVAGMETETDRGEEYSYSYMPRESAERRGRTNQGYDVSPPEDRRRPDVIRVSSRHPAWDEGTGVPPPPPYTERDVSPPQLRSAGHGWGRSNRRGSWAAADSDRSSTVAAGWTQRTRVVFAVMLLLCIILLLALVVVVALYFTTGPGKDCLNKEMCDSPSIGYIAAFCVIGFLAFIFMLIGIILCCFACRISRDKRMQDYPVSARR
eukprot:XP_011662052.1 PREDICTED: uncharacterized protein LOC753079 isoform X2 [Strongylocentrotus purpuratus]